MEAPTLARIRRALSLAGLAFGCCLCRSASAQIVVTWSSASGGSWTNASNWLTSIIPINGSGNSYEALIHLPGAYTVTLTNSESIAGLEVNGSGATLALNGVTLALQPSLVAGVLDVGSGATLALTGSSISTPNGFGPYAFSNEGMIKNASGISYVYGSNTTGNGLAFTNSGAVQVTGGTLNLGYYSSDAVTNTASGTIAVSGSGQLNLNGGTAIINLGALQATSGGTIDLGGSFTTADLGGTINATTGTINITGILTNTSATLSPPNGGGLYTLDGGKIVGGVVNSAALTFGTASGTLSGATFSGSANIPTNGNFTVTDGTVFSGGTLTFNNSTIFATNAGATALTLASGELWQGNVTIEAITSGTTIQNNGTINVTTGTNYIYNAGLGFTNSGTVETTGGALLLGVGTGDSVTNSPGAVIAANGGNLSLATGASASLTNHGTIQASPGNIVTIGGSATAGTWTNDGTIAANGGTIYLGGSYTTSTLASGTINATTGTVYISGALSNTSTSLPAPSGGGVYTLGGGTITGGTTPSSSLAFSLYSGTLSGVTFTGSEGIASSEQFTATNGTVFSAGTLTFGSASVLVTGGGSPSLTIASGEIWQGTFSIEAITSGATVQNNGTINVTSGTNYIYNSGIVFTNSATVESTGGNLLLGAGTGDTIVNASGATISAGNNGSVSIASGSGAQFTNDGSVVSSPGATVILGGAWTNSGTLSTNGGVMNLGGTYSTSTLTSGQIVATSGTVYLSGVLTNTSATLQAPDGGGIFTLGNGGRIVGGTVLGSALTFSSQGGILDGTTLTGTFTANPNASVSLINNPILSNGSMSFQSGTLNLIGGGTAQAFTIGSGTTVSGDFSINSQIGGLTLTNLGTITTTGGGDYIYDSGLIIQNSGTISSTSGNLYVGVGSGDHIVNNTGATLTANGGNVSLATGTGASLVNTGLIQATAGSTVTIGSGSSTWSNVGGVISANGGSVYLGGSYSTSNLTEGTINATSGSVYISGALNNTSATLSTPDGGGVFTLRGGTIYDGTVNSADLVLSAQGGTLDGATLAGSMTAVSGASVSVKNSTLVTGGTLNFLSGSINLLAGSTANALTIASGAALAGNFSINSLATGLTFVNNGSLLYTGGSNYLYDSGIAIQNNGALTVTSAGVYIAEASNDSVTNAGTGTIIANNGAYVTLASGTGATLTNDGLIEANAGATVVLGSTGSTWSNTGTIQANGGIVQLNGAFTTESLTTGTILDTSGSVQITGTVTTTSGTPLAPPATGVYTLNGGTISGVTITSGALTFGPTAGTLAGDTLQGNITGPSTGSAAVSSNGSTFTGGTLSFPSAGGFTLFLGSPASTTTFASSETLSGLFSIYADANVTLLNEGQMIFSGSSADIQGNGSGFTYDNAGLFEANAGSAVLGYYASDVITNTGTIEANKNSVLYLGYNLSEVSNLHSGVLSGGTWIAANGGILSFEGSSPITTIDLGTTVGLSGSSSGIRTRSGSSGSYQTLAQTLTTVNGTFEIGGGSIFTSSNGLTDSGTIQLSTGTLSAPSLVNAPGSVLSGTGTVSTSGTLTFGSGATLSPGVATSGLYVGTLTLGPSVVLGAGGGAIFDLKTAASTAIAGTDNDTIAVTGALSVAASSSTPFQIALESVNSTTAQPGLMSFNTSQSDQWTLMSSTSLSNFNASDFSLNLSGFSNSLDGGSFSLAASGNDIVLDFTPVPEPSTWVLMGLGAGLLGCIAWRRRLATLS